LVPGTRSSDPAGDNFSSFRYKIFQHALLFVIDPGPFISAEAAHLTA